MIPVNLPTIRADGNGWTVIQTFDYMGKRVTLTGWGRLRAEALQCLEREKQYHMEERPFDLLEDLGAFLMDTGTDIDTVLNLVSIGIKALWQVMVRIKNFIKGVNHEQTRISKH